MKIRFLAEFRGFVIKGKLLILIFELKRYQETLKTEFSSLLLFVHKSTLLKIIDMFVAS
jgi:hypothetical protein